jgi:putative polyhydroxyalkanoate system protein
VSDISIHYSHQLSRQGARAAAQKVAEQLAAEYEVTTEWKDDVLCFERSGICGTLALHEKHAQLDIELGLLMKAFAPVISTRVEQKMKKVFAGNT